MSETLVHKLGCKSSRTTKELLDITTSHASWEDAVGAIFDDHRKQKAKQDKEADGRTNKHLEKERKETSNNMMIC